MSNSWDWPGSRWWKFDFHTHTPASADTHWAQNDATLTPEAWLLRYMDAEVDCVAVTDHNSGAWLDRLNTAYDAMRAAQPAGFRELHVFPGVELSVNGGFHLLAIFDKSKTTSDIDTLLGKVDYAGTKGASDGVTRKSALEVIEAVIQSGGLPIPAHVDGPKGLLQCATGETASPQLDANTLRQICDSTGIRAIEVLNATVPKPQLYLDSKCNWTEVVGSDWHGSATGPSPGSRFTWIKMSGPPSLDGLHLALLDGPRFSVRRSDDAEGFNPFKRPEHFITEVTIQDARFMGRGQAETLRFSPWFNALVGGRGTGKSTVAHALRLAYRRESDLGRETEALRVFEAFGKVHKSRTDPGGLELNTEVLVSVSRDAVQHRLRWRQDTAGNAVEDRNGASWSPSASQNIGPERFPIRIFSQGQMAGLASEGHGALLALIDENAATRDAKRKLDEANARFLGLRAQKRELQGKLDGRDEVNVQLEDVKRKLAGFEGKEHAAILKDYQRSSRQERELQRQLESARMLAEQVEGLARQLIVDDAPPGLFNDQDATEHSALAILAGIRGAVEAAASAVQAVGTTLLTSLRAAREEADASAWGAATTWTKQQYVSLIAELQAQGVADPGEYGKLVQERQRLEGEVGRFDALRKEHDRVASQALEQRRGTRLARQELSNTRRTFLETALEQNEYVKISLVPYGQDHRALERAFREALGVPDERFGSDILVMDSEQPEQGLVADLLRELPESPSQAGAAFEVRLDQLTERLERAAQGGRDFGGAFGNYLARESTRHPEFLDRMLIFAPEDTLSVEYSLRGDGKDFRPINQASAGQQAAAMLAFLLAQGTEPIVLDQPEDDLDNHLIYDLVVRQLRENKMRRQVIVITHNPNIVVNGDAEMIHALDFKGGLCRVVERGSLQEGNMREEVCRIMEGGREAFERRYQRLGRTS